MHPYRALITRVMPCPPDAPSAPFPFPNLQCFQDSAFLAGTSLSASASSHWFLSLPLSSLTHHTHTHTHSLSLSLYLLKESTAYPRPVMLMKLISVSTSLLCRSVKRSYSEIQADI